MFQRSQSLRMLLQRFLHSSTRRLCDNGSFHMSGSFACAAIAFDSGEKSMNYMCVDGRGPQQQIQLDFIDLLEKQDMLSNRDLPWPTVSQDNPA